MEKIYNDAKDQHVANNLVYAGASNKACADSAGAVQLSGSELYDAFMKGCLIVTSAGYFAPVSCARTSATGVVTLTYITVSSNTVSAATVVSKADA